MEQKTEPNPNPVSYDPREPHDPTVEEFLILLNGPAPQKEEPTDEDLFAISLEDLDLDLSPTKLKSTIDLALINELKNPTEAKKVDNPFYWTPEASVFFIEEIHCKLCGSVFQTPRSKDPILVRYRNRRDPQKLWYTPAPHLCKSLPREVSITPSTTLMCHICWDNGECTQHQEEEQV